MKLHRAVMLAACFCLLSSSWPALRGSASPAPAPGAINPTVIDWRLTPAQITSQCNARLKRARSDFQRLAARTGAMTFDTAVLPLENLSSDLGDDLVAQTFLSQVSASKPVRDAALDCQNALAAFGAETAANPHVYRQLKQARSSATAATVYDRALTDVWITVYEQAGAGLGARDRLEFVALSKQLNDIQTRFNHNIADDTTSVPFTDAAITGLSPELRSTLKRGSEGAYIVPVNDSTFPQFLGNVRSEASRKRFYYAYSNIQAGANTQLLEHAIAIRQRLAHLLGFHNWAEYQMHTRTEMQPATIMHFLTDLDAHVMPAARQDIARLRALKAKQTGDPAARLQPWDVAYYLNELTKSQYALDQNVVKQYFPAPHTVDAVLAFYEHLLGVRFSPVKPANAWYPDVTEFAVTDSASGKFIGTFLLDLYPRPGKPGGAFNAPIISVRRLAAGRFRPPVSAMIVSDWPAASNGKPALLTHDDVVVFLHEFGHCMAAMLATTPYETLSQFNSDFVEAPSQMLENFGWNKAILKRLTSNVTTGAPMPDALIDRLLAARCLSDRLCNGYAATRQVLYSIFDLDVHMAGPHVDTTAVWARVAHETTPIDMAPGIHPPAQFSHETSGYDAGYYVYLWSLVYAQDMFTAFQRGGVFNAQIGMRYRQTILAPARTYSPDAEVKNFLGRPMSPDAFYRGFAGH